MATLPAEPGFWLAFGFIALPIAMAVGFGIVLRSKLVAAVGLAWAAITALIGFSGWLADFSTLPPRMFAVFIPTVVGVVYLAFSRFGKRLAHFSFVFLVGFQSFRILVELLIHEAVVQGIAPPQMTWSGMNLDIITGIAAILLMPFAGRLPKWALHLFNVGGFALLATVVTVAILSMPTSFQRITPDNVWVAFFPFVWLPTILVAFALLGHLALFRKLAMEEE